MFVLKLVAHPGLALPCLSLPSAGIARPREPVVTDGASGPLSVKLTVSCALALQLLQATWKLPNRAVEKAMCSFILSHTASDIYINSIAVIMKMPPVGGRQEGSTQLLPVSVISAEPYCGVVAFAIL